MPNIGKKRALASRGPDLETPEIPRHRRRHHETSQDVVFCNERETNCMFSGGHPDMQANQISKGLASRQNIEWMIANKINLNIKYTAGQTLLIIAAKCGYRDSVQLLLEHGALLDAADGRGYVALHRACDRGHCAIAALILDAGAGVDVRTDAGVTPLQLASRRGHSKVVELLLEHGAEVNLCDERGYTALHEAAWFDRLDTTKVLLRYRASAFTCTEDGDMPLHAAAQQAQQTLVQLLINATDGNLDVRNVSGGNTPLHFACQANNAKVVYSLIRQGANVNITNRAGKRPLDLAVWAGASFSVIYSLRTGSVNSGSSIGTDFSCEMSSQSPQIRHGEYSSSLWSFPTAVWFGLKTLTQRLFQPDVNFAGVRDVYTPLQDAVWMANTDIVRFLLRTGANPNAPVNHGSKPLHIAAAQGHSEIAQLLIKWGVDLYSTDLLGLTPLDLAVNAGHANVVDILVAGGAHTAPKFSADGILSTGSVKKVDQEADDNQDVDAVWLPCQFEFSLYYEPIQPSRLTVICTPSRTPHPQAPSRNNPDNQLFTVEQHLLWLTSGCSDRKLVNSAFLYFYMSDRPELLSCREVNITLGMKVNLEVPSMDPKSGLIEPVGTLVIKQRCGDEHIETHVCTLCFGPQRQILLTDGRLERLRRLWRELVKRVRFQLLLPWLVQEEIIEMNSREYSLLEDTWPSQNKTALLLRLISQKGDDKYDRFCHILQKVGFSDLASDLDRKPARFNGI